MQVNITKRYIVFVHYDKHNIVDNHVHFYLNALSKISSQIIFITTSAIPQYEIEKLSKVCSQVVLRENVGYDFMSYETGINLVDISAIDELVLCNDSIYGPMQPLEKVFEKMSQKSFDVWGITESYEINYHLQSYFLVFGKKALNSDVFKEFWSEVKVIDDKKQLIKAYEIGLSQRFVRKNLKLGSFISSKISLKEFFKFYILPNMGLQCNLIQNINVLKKMILFFGKIVFHFNLKQFNITHLFWNKILLQNKMPFIKIELLRDNPMKLCSVRKYKDILTQIKSDYPIELIEKHLDRMKFGIKKNSID